MHSEATPQEFLQECVLITGETWTGYSAFHQTCITSNTTSNKASHVPLFTNIDSVKTHQVSIIENRCPTWEKEF